MTNDKMKKGSKTVDPIKSKREIQTVKNYLSGKNLRDYTIFVVGINSALRVSDVVKLKWEDVFYEIGELKKEIRLSATTSSLDELSLCKVFFHLPFYDLLLGILFHRIFFGTHP